MIPPFPGSNPGAPASQSLFYKTFPMRVGNPRVAGLFLVCEGFGSTVVDLMAKRTVGGEVRLDYAASGLMWRLTCPAANALELGRRAA